MTFEIGFLKVDCVWILSLIAATGPFWGQLSFNSPISSVQISRSVISNSLQPHELQHTRPPGPSPTPRVYSNSRPSSQWCHPAISPSVSPFSSSSQSFPASEYFSESALCIRWPEYWGFSISPSSEYSGPISFRIDWFDFLAVQGTFNSLLQKHNFKASVLWCLAFFMIQLSHLYMTAEKQKQLWLYGPLLAKWCICFFNILFQFA